MHRRRVLEILLLAGAAPLALSGPALAYEVTHSDAEWKKLLSPDAYRVLRHADTERHVGLALAEGPCGGLGLCECIVNDPGNE